MVGERFPLVRVEADRAGFALRINNHLASLENLYRTVAQHPEDFRHQVERWIVELLRAAEGHPDEREGFGAIKGRILPMVLSPEDVLAHGDAALAQPLVEGLCVAYAIDNDRSITYIPKPMFESWGVTLDELHETAIENLLGRSDGLQATAAQDDEGAVNLVLVQTLDGYDASRILLPTLHQQLSPLLGPTFGVGIPNRDILVCFRTSDEIAHRLGRQIAEDYRTMPHRVTDHLFLVTADGIAPFTPPDEPPP